MYAVTLDGSTEPIHVVVPVREDHWREHYAAVMFAREKAEKWQSHRALRNCDRGPIVEVLDA